jgi:hypothetical protein
LEAATMAENFIEIYEKLGEDGAKEGSTSCSEDIPITGNVPNKHGFSL